MPCSGTPPPTLPATVLVKNKFSVLKFVNQSARIYGLDLSGHMPLAKNHG
jgi:iron complex outermembrane receptor protein